MSLANSNFPSPGPGLSLPGENDVPGTPLTPPDKQPSATARSTMPDMSVGGPEEEEDIARASHELRERSPPEERPFHGGGVRPERDEWRRT